MRAVFEAREVMAQDSPAGGPAPVHLTLAGTDALDPFRRERRLQRIREHTSGVTALDARYVYFLDCDGEIGRNIQVETGAGGFIRGDQSDAGKESAPD